MKPILAVLLLSIALNSCSSTATNVSVNTAPATNEAPSEPSAPPAGAGGVDQAVAAETLIADLYKAHDGKRSPFFQTRDRALVDKYFAKQLADLIWKDAVSSKGEVGAIDADPLYNGQDIEIKNFAIGKAEVKGETARVPVTFNNFGEKQTVNFALRLVGGSWKIENINYRDNFSLLSWLHGTGDTKADEVADFQGRYQVGDTSCTVKPVKLAFEVRWAKGSGVEMFFYQDGNTFESEPGKRGTNRFVFDDATYDNGTFYRADGKTFAVSRGR